MKRLPPYTMEMRDPALKVHTNIFVAIRIADEFRDELPTVQQLQDRFGMSRATAYRWVTSLRIARETPHDG